MPKPDTDMIMAASLPFLRSFPLEDIRILSRSEGSEYADGRTVEAYAAAWGPGVRAEVADAQGHYLEEIDSSAFNKAVSDARPAGRRAGWNVGVFYNHGMTIHGTPSDRFSVPLGVPVDVRVESRGLMTVTRYNDGPLAEEILEAIRSGAITAQSFSGRIIRSDPARPPRGGFRRGADGALKVVRRLELGLREYGPTPFPVFADAAVIGVRSLFAAGLWPGTTLAATPDPEADEPEAEPAPADTPPEPSEDTPADAEATEAERAEAVADEPPSEEEHSSRSALLRRIAAAKTTRPGLDPDAGADRRRERTEAITRGGSE